MQANIAHPFKPTPHGGIDEAELRALGLERAAVVDFSVNVNPFGPSPAVLAAARAAPVDAYPDPTAWRARQAMAPHLGVEPEHIALANGANALLWTLAQQCTAGGATAVVPRTTYGEFAAAVSTAGGSVVPCELRDDLTLDLITLARQVRQHRASVLYLAAPNTPTGACVPIADVCALATDLPATTVVLDQSFLSMSQRHAEALVAVPDNVVRVRSLTKDHALCGLRVGYLLATAQRVARLEAARPAWSTSSPALAAAVAAVAQTEFVTQSRARWLAASDALRDALAAWRPLPSTTAFFLLEVPSAATLRRRLLTEHRVQVRDCTSFGLPGHVRIGARGPDDNARLVAALHAMR